jgi:hypothetical protein
MTREEIYIAALDNCLGRKNDNLTWENCQKCPYFGRGYCQNELREGIACNTNPDAFIAVGLIKEGYIKPYKNFVSVAIPYSEVSLKPTKEKNQKVKWLNDTYFTIPEKETKYDIYDKYNNIVYSTSFIEEATDYIKNLVIKVVTD